MKNKLAVLMAERGLKIADLYKDTGISKTTLMQVANNTGKGIQYETLEKLLDYFDISPNEFFGYESKATITSFENLGRPCKFRKQNYKREKIIEMKYREKEVFEAYSRNKLAIEHHLNDSAIIELVGWGK